ncbi:MAG: glucose-6-phosphate dehydrogenase [Steroidobacteraceae bacterium]
MTLPTFDLILAGAAGDLSIRKLLPALYRRHRAGKFSDDSRVICLVRSDGSREEFLDTAKQRLTERLGEEFSSSSWTAFSRHVEVLKVDAMQSDDFLKLRSLLSGRDDHIRVFFLSTPPSLFVDYCAGFKKAEVVTAKSRVVLEKPLGYDRASAQLINNQVSTFFAENQIYRIDHYLGKEPVQNLMALRFGNGVFEPIWRRGRIKDVHITVTEKMGVEGRAAFYDRTGALRDMVQSHLLQLLCIIAMEPPVSGDPDDIRDEKLKVLKALRPLAGSAVTESVVRAQYRAGAMGNTTVCGYREERGVAPDSQTETFVAMKLHVETWRWAGVPFYLLTGKRMTDQVAEISIAFEDVPHAIFEREAAAYAGSRLVIRLQPDENITLTLLAKTPGEGVTLTPVNLGLDLSGSRKERSMDAYERLLTDVINGNLTLFMRWDELDAAWKWIDPIQEAWATDVSGPLTYEAGTFGPLGPSPILNRFVQQDSQ